MACQAVMDDNVFDKLCFINEIGTQFPSQLREEVRTHSVQDTSAVIHGENQNVGGLKLSLARHLACHMTQLGGDISKNCDNSEWITP
jgi:hypothetical protein